MTRAGFGRPARDIFISYRRNDTGGQAGRIFDRLEREFGRKRVFMDVDGIEPGESFMRIIEHRLASTGIVLVLIGERWRGEGKPPRIHDPHDPVRKEVAHALSREIRVIPVLVNGAALPGDGDLPDDLRALRQRNYLRVDDESFNDDLERVIRALPPRRRIERLLRNVMFGAAALLVALPASVPIYRWIVGGSDESKEQPDEAACSEQRPERCAERCIDNPGSSACTIACKHGDHHSCCNVVEATCSEPLDARAFNSLSALPPSAAACSEWSTCRENVTKLVGDGSVDVELAQHALRWSCTDRARDCGSLRALNTQYFARFSATEDYERALPEDCKRRIDACPSE